MVVVIANHFQVRGSGADDGTGQGLSSPSREAQARDVTAWADQIWPGEAIFQIGDFNAYSKETPVQIIEAAGYTDLGARSTPESTSYQFGGRLGSLDHALRQRQGPSPWSAAPMTSTSAPMRSVAMQYFHVAAQHRRLPKPTMYAASDHDRCSSVSSGAEAASHHQHPGLQQALRLHGRRL